MFGRIKTIVCGIIMALNIVVTVSMLAVGYSDRLNPETYPMLSGVGLVFPLFVIADIIFIVIWIVLRPKYAVLPVTGLILCYLPVRTYCPLNIRRDIPAGALKVVSFNAAGFDTRRYPRGDDGIHPAAAFIRDMDADIVCLQEAPVNDALRRYLDDTYPYIDTTGVKNGSSLALLSKYPVVGKQHIEYASAGNLSAAFLVVIDGDTVTVVNNHFETSGLSLDDRAGFSSIMHDAKDNIDHGHMPADTVRQESLRLFAKLGESARKRAPQARAVAAFVSDRRGKSIILCGDFNDTPISYTHHTVGRDLTDCYAEGANGPGWTFVQNSMRVRIDNIMCSEHWQTCRCLTDRSRTVSDHFPVVAWLTRRQ